MKQRKKFITVIMNRVYSRDGEFIYVAGHPEIGYYDEQTNIFKDRNGNEYLHLLDKSLMISELNEAHYGTMPLSELKKITGKSSLQESISNYLYESRRNIYYVSKLRDGNQFVIPIILNDLKETLENATKISPQEELNKQNSISEDKNINYEEENIKDFTDREIKILLYSKISDILSNMIDGKYTLEELKTISEEYKDEKDEIEGLIESIDIQIEASNKGESKNTIKDYPQIQEVQKKPDNYIDIRDLYNTVKKTLIAQDEPLRRVITEIVRKEDDPHGKEKAILLTGSSGVGKTKMMSLISKYINKPFLRVDSTQLTVPGYVGKDIVEVLWELYLLCGKDKNKTENAIIFFDEIDKKGSSKKEDVSGKGVLNTLLPFIEGSVYQACEDSKKSSNNVRIDTSKMTVIFGGAFEDVYNAEKKDNTIGFASEINKQEDNITIDDFVEKAKMPKEFMGRISTIVKLNDLDVESLKRILLESDESALKDQEIIFKKLGVKLTPGYDYVYAIAQQALAKKTGARGINSAIEETTWEAYADVHSNIGKYSEIVLEKETVENPKQYKKVLRRNNQ